MANNPCLDTLGMLLSGWEGLTPNRHAGAPTELAALGQPLLDAIDTVVFIADDGGAFRYLSAAWSRLTGFSSSESLNRQDLAYLHPRDQEAWLDFLAGRLNRRSGLDSVVVRFLTRSGDSIRFEARADAVFDGAGQCIGFVGTLSDVNERILADELKQASHRAVETLINNLPGLVYRGRNNRQWTMEFVSDGCLALTGYPPQALINNDRLTFADLIVPEDRQQVWDNVQTALRENRPFELTYRIRTANGKEKWVLERGRGNFSTNGELLGLEGFITDVTAEKLTELRLQRDSLRDAVTNLPTPSLFVDRLELALRRAVLRRDLRYVLLFVYLDRFSKWRATFGPAYGERALIDVARRIEKVLSPVDSLCRWHDDEFVILHECATAEESVHAISNRIQEALRAPIADGDNELFLTVSIGVAQSTSGYTGAEEMLRDAASAMARAKELGGARVELAVSDSPPGARRRRGR